MRSPPTLGKLDLILKTCGLEGITIVLYFLSNWLELRKQLKRRLWMLRVSAGVLCRWCWWFVSLQVPLVAPCPFNPFYVSHRGLSSPTLFFPGVKLCNF